MTPAGPSTARGPRSCSSRRVDRVRRAALCTGRTASRPRSVAAERFVALPPDALVLGTALHLVVPALLAGARVLIGSPRDPAGLACSSGRLGITHLSLPPHLALAFARAGGTARLLVLGSAPVRNVTLRELVDRMPGCEIRPVYGMSEYLLVASIDARERLDARRARRRPRRPADRRRHGADRDRRGAACRGSGARARLPRRADAVEEVATGTSRTLDAVGSRSCCSGAARR